MCEVVGKSHEALPAIVREQSQSRGRSGSAAARGHSVTRREHSRSGARRELSAAAWMTSEAEPFQPLFASDFLRLPPGRQRSANISRTAFADTEMLAAMSMSNGSRQGDVLSIERHIGWTWL